eukprot:TRINITY_DN9533_c0_g1_i1.p1 TRINITY_DN9533_c0_g1~~TRINITY_DN9533_c0_g1_i1.p1  ORF type:complete len:1037 (-),score=354.75 TRINITY_DN9533_c0_g1_i1:355-3465(-)
MSLLAPPAPEAPGGAGAEYEGIIFLRVRCDSGMSKLMKVQRSLLMPALWDKVMANPMVVREALPFFCSQCPLKPQKEIAREVHLFFCNGNDAESREVTLLPHKGVPIGECARMYPAAGEKSDRPLELLLGVLSVVRGSYKVSDFRSTPSPSASPRVSLDEPSTAEFASPRTSDGSARRGSSAEHFTDEEDCGPIPESMFVRVQCDMGPSKIIKVAGDINMKQLKEQYVTAKSVASGALPFLYQQSPGMSEREVLEQCLFFARNSDDAACPWIPLPCTERVKLWACARTYLDERGTLALLFGVKPLIMARQKKARADFEAKLKAALPKRKDKSSRKRSEEDVSGNVVDDASGSVDSRVKKLLRKEEKLEKRIQELKALEQQLLQSCDALGGKKPNKKAQVRLDLDKAQPCEFLGAGGSGTKVRNCIVNGWSCAVKELDIASCVEYDIEAFEREIILISGLDHENIVKYLGHTVSANALSLYVSRYSITLSKLIQMRRQGDGMKELLETGCAAPPAPGSSSDEPKPYLYFTKAEVLHIALNVAKGMQYLHRNFVIYRDLKSDNVFIRYGDNGFPVHVAIGDFDTAVRPGVTGEKPHEVIGTTRFMSPEVFSCGNKHPYSYPADVYSFGMFLLEVMTLEEPYAEIDRVFHVGEAIQEGRPPEVPQRCKDEYEEIVALHQACIQRKPEFRPTFDQVVREIEDKLASASQEVEVKEALSSAHGKWKSTAIPPELAELLKERLMETKSESPQQPQSFIDLDAKVAAAAGGGRTMSTAPPVEVQKDKGRGRSHSVAVEEDLERMQSPEDGAWAKKSRKEIFKLLTSDEGLLGEMQALSEGAREDQKKEKGRTKASSSGKEKKRTKKNQEKGSKKGQEGENGGAAEDEEGVTQDPAQSVEAEGTSGDGSDVKRGEAQEGEGGKQKDSAKEEGGDSGEKKKKKARSKKKQKRAQKSDSAEALGEDGPEEEGEQEDGGEDGGEAEGRDGEKDGDGVKGDGVKGEKKRKSGSGKKSSDRAKSSGKTRNERAGSSGSVDVPQAASGSS